MFLLNLLKGGRLSAGEICEHFSVTGVSISRHLAILKDADLIRSTYRAVKSIDNIEELDVENVIKMALKKIY